MVQRWVLASAACLALGGFGCVDDGHGDHHHDGSHGHDGFVAEECDAEERAMADTYETNLAKTSMQGRYRVILLEADPAPPEKRSDNRFLLRIENESGEPVDAAVSVRPFMPSHNHGSPTSPRVSPGDEAGSYVVDSINFIMGGLWSVRVDVEGPAGADRAEYLFCIDS